MSNLGDSLGGMSIGDFAMNLIESGDIQKDTSFGKGNAPEPSPVDSFQKLPEAGVDLSNTEVSNQLVENILQTSFGIEGNTLVSETKVQEVPEPENTVDSLREEVQDLKEDLTQTIKQFTSILSRLFEITEMTGCFNLGTHMGAPPPDPMNPRNKKRKKKRGRS